MRTKVAAEVADGGLRLRLTEEQRQLIREVLQFHFDSPDVNQLSTARLGVDRASVSQMMRKISGPSVELQVGEIHTLFAALVSAPALILSEEAFYERIGFFRENSIALAAGLVNAIGTL